MRAVMVPSARASAPKSPPAASGEPPDGVEVAQRGQGQRPAPRTVGQRLLHHPEVAPSHTQRTSGAATWLKPDSSSATMRSTSGRGAVARATGRRGGRPGRRNRAPWRRRRPAARPPVRDAARRCAPWPAAAAASCASRSASVQTASPSSSSSRPSAASSPERRKWGSSATPRRPTTRWARRRPDGGHDVEQARAGPAASTSARSMTMLALRRDPAQPEPRLGQRAQRLVALGRHSGTSLSSGTRSNHRNP